MHISIQSCRLPVFFFSLSPYPQFHLLGNVIILSQQEIIENLLVLLSAIYFKLALLAENVSRPIGSAAT
jgi:hypothetical protein